MYTKITVVLLILILALTLGVIVYWYTNNTFSSSSQNTQIATKKAFSFPSYKKILSPTPVAFPEVYTLAGGTHSFQTFNNCGPASLSMALSHYGLNISQQEIGLDLRPWQNAAGDNDDKSVTLEELAAKSKEYGFTPFHRPVGNVELVKRFVSNGIPVITRTWLNPNDDIGHYRVIKGYNTTSFLQDDSLQGKDLWYSYSDFNEIWKKFNYEYLVLIPSEKLEIAESILSEDLDQNHAWQKAVNLSRDQLMQNPEDIYARFNLSVALYNIEDYQGSADEFEVVQDKIPFRTLWYQIEPILAYYELGNFDRVFEITDRVLNNHNRAFSELYIIRGDIYKQQGNLDAARQQYQQAILYNQNLDTAHEALLALN